MWRELGVPPVRAAAAARRARAWFKFPYLKTWIGVLCKHQQPKGPQVRAWVASTRTWLKCNKFLEADGGAGEEDPDEKESKYEAVLRAEWGAAERSQKAVATSIYLSSNYMPLSSMVAIPPLGRREQVKLGTGLRMMSLCRIGALRTATSLANARLVHDNHKDICPCCQALIFGRGEDVSHILVECPRWEKERELYLGHFIRQLQNDYGGPLGLGSDQLGVFLLGGAIGEQRIRNWLPPRKVAGCPDPSREAELFTVVLWRWRGFSRVLSGSDVKC